MAKIIPRIVIIGGGFAGLNAARIFRGRRVEVTVVDRKNHHLFQPLLYQVATASLNPSDIAVPIRSIFRAQENVTVRLDRIDSVDATSKRLITSGGSIEYDYLIIATGATHSYFGNEAWELHAPGLKTIEDALEIRKRVLLAYEMAEKASSHEEQREWMTFVVIGAGPTGVEMAGALSEIAMHSMSKDFRRIDPKSARIVLLEGADRVLQAYPAELSAKAQRQLEELGVEVKSGKRVTGVSDREVTFENEKIGTRTVIWAAGVQASPLAASLGVPLDRAGRVMVEKDLSVPGHPEIFVAGDLALVMSHGKAVPGVAPAAMQEGKHAAKNIVRLIEGQPTARFVYVDKGSLATIGRAAAVADFGKLRFSGFFAWFLWLGIHIFFLIGFRNRLFVLLQWAWAYLTYRRGARLITGAESQRRATENQEEVQHQNQ